MTQSLISKQNLMLRNVLLPCAVVNQTSELQSPVSKEAEPQIVELSDSDDAKELHTEKVVKKDPGAQETERRRNTTVILSDDDKSPEKKIGQARQGPARSIGRKARVNSSDSDKGNFPGVESDCNSEDLEVLFPKEPRKPASRNAAGMHLQRIAAAKKRVQQNSGKGQPNGGGGVEVVGESPYKRRPKQKVQKLRISPFHKKSGPMDNLLELAGCTPIFDDTEDELFMSTTGPLLDQRGPIRPLQHLLKPM